MDRSLVESFDRLCAQRKSILEQFAGLSESQLNFRHNPEDWSLLEELHHLVLVDTQILIQIENPTLVTKMAKQKSKIPYFIVMAVLRSGIRVPVPNNDERLLPQPGQSLSTLVNEWKVTLDKIQGQLEALSGERIHSPFMVHPMCGGIKPAPFIYFLMAHDGYHLRNIKRTKRSKSLPK